MSEMFLVIETPNADYHKFMVSVSESLQENLLANFTAVKFTKKFERSPDGAANQFGPDGATDQFAFGINYLGVRREVRQRCPGRPGDGRLANLTAVLVGVAADQLSDVRRQELLEQLRTLLSREDELVKGIDWTKASFSTFSKVLQVWCGEHCRDLSAAPFASGPPKDKGHTQQEEAKESVATAKASPSRNWKTLVLVGLVVIAVVVGGVYWVSSRLETGKKSDDVYPPPNPINSQIAHLEQEFKDRPPQTPKDFVAFRAKLRELQNGAAEKAQTDRIDQMINQLEAREHNRRADQERKTQDYLVEKRKQIKSATSVRQLKELHGQLLSPPPLQLAALNRSEGLKKIQQDGLSELAKCLEKKQDEEWRADFQHLLERQRFALAAALLREEPPSPDTKTFARDRFRECARKAVREQLDWAVAVMDFAEARKYFKLLFRNPDVRKLVDQKEEEAALAQLAAREDRWLYERFRNADGPDKLRLAQDYLDSEEPRSMNVVVERWLKYRHYRHPLGLTLKTADLAGEQPPILTVWLIPQKNGSRTEQKKWNSATKAFDPDEPLVVDLAGATEWTVELKVSFPLSSGETANYSYVLSLKRSKLPEERQVELARKPGMGPRTIQLLLRIFDPVAEVPEWRPSREPQP